MATFVGLSGDFNPLYTDVEHARAAHFGEPVVPGALVAAVTTGLGAIDVPVPATVGMVGMSWRFLRPVRPGDTISARWRLNRKRPVENPRWGLVVWQVEVENQRGELVAMAEVTRLVSRREHVLDQGRQAKSSRRRRGRRGIPEVAVGADMPPKPTPGPLHEPLRPVPEQPWRQPQPAQRPAAEQPPAPAEEWRHAPATDQPAAHQPEAAPEGPSRRRRRGSGRSRPEQQTPAPEPAIVTPEVPAAAVPEAPTHPPEEAPAAAAPPPWQVVPEPAAPPEVPVTREPEVAAVTSDHAVITGPASQPGIAEAPAPPARRRRRRPSAPEAPAEPVPVVSPAPEPAAEMPRPEPEQPEPAPAPRRRRRRAAEATEAAQAQAHAPERPPADSQPEPSAEPVEARPRRRRRSRAPEQPAAESEPQPEAPPPTVPAPEPPAEPRPAIPSPFRPPAGDASGGLAGVRRGWGDG